MKKALSANVNGKIFYIDEDAYELLNNYLTQLHGAFPGEEGAEIVTDIESRVREHFEERTRTGQDVIVLADVNRVIDIIGRPEELSGENAEGGTVPPPYTGPQPAEPVRKRLYRDERNRVLGGVLSGLGHYFGWDTTVLRILVVIVALCTYVMPCLFIYLVAWMIIPPARTPRQILEMEGEPVNIYNIGRTVVNQVNDTVTSASSGRGFRSFVDVIFRAIGVFVMGCIALVAGVIAVVSLIIAVGLVVGIVFAGYSFAADILPSLDIESVSEAWGVVCAALAVMFPMVALVWAACTGVFRLPMPSRPVIITGIVMEIILIGITIAITALG